MFTNSRSQTQDHKWYPDTMHYGKIALPSTLQSFQASHNHKVLVSNIFHIVSYCSVASIVSEIGEFKGCQNLFRRKNSTKLPDFKVWIRRGRLLEKLLGMISYTCLVLVFLSACLELASAGNSIFRLWTYLKWSFFHSFLLDNHFAVWSIIQVPYKVPFGLLSPWVLQCWRTCHL